MQITEGKVEAYRAKVKVSFKYEGRAVALLRLQTLPSGRMSPGDVYGQSSGNRRRP